MYSNAEKLRMNNSSVARVCLAAAVCHWLSAAGLIERVFDLDAELFEQF
jgi:hypothetical protein